MTPRWLLDTNAVIALRETPHYFDATFGQRDRFYVSVLTLGEMYYGGLKSDRKGENLFWLASFVQRNNVLQCDIGTAQVYGALNWELRKKGRPIPHNDFWIAATALQHNLIVVTQDNHFNGIDGLTVIDWQGS